MEEEHLLMSKKERQRLLLLERVVSGALNRSDAAALLGLSIRQMRRIYRRYCQEGAAGLVHRGRGKPSSRSRPCAFRERVLERYESEYRGLGPTLAAEKLQEDGLTVDHETLRRWLMKEGKWQRHRKRHQHRARRPPKEHFGELVQMDGSHHRWFGQDKEPACLMSLVDDATGAAMTLLAGQETTEAAMELLQRWVERYGIPKALYTDRKSVYVSDRAPTLEEQLAGEEPLTAFGQACGKIGIQIIRANSPQAKGRVERKHGVYQDRLFHELRLRRITTIEAANQLLQQEFDEQLNQKFARAPRSSLDFHRPLPKNTDLRDIFCYEETRVLANDWTISYQRQLLQILKLNHPLPKPKSKITVRIWRDGSIHLLWKEKPLVFQTVEHPPQTNKAPASTPKAPRPKNKPRHGHPWKKALKATKRAS